MKIYLLRHPQTTGGSDVRYYGATDLDLSELGQRQRDALAERFKDVPLDAIYSSALRRAAQTAAAIAKPHGLTPMQIPVFNELNFGLWEGLTAEEIRDAYPEQYIKWMKRDGTFEYPQGDSVPGFRARVLSGLDQLLDNPLESTILLVGHAGINRILLTRMMDVGWPSFWSMEMDLASINLIEYDGMHYKIAVLNDTCHLTAAGCGGP